MWCTVEPLLTDSPNRRHLCVADILPLYEWTCNQTIQIDPAYSELAQLQTMDIQPCTNWCHCITMNFSQRTRGVVLWKRRGCIVYMCSMCIFMPNDALASVMLSGYALVSGNRLAHAESTVSNWTVGPELGGHGPNQFVCIWITCVCGIQ